MKKVAIQGVKASFHHIAAMQNFGEENVSFLECRSFPEVFERMENDDCDTAVVAIENTLTGSLLPNYSLLHHSDLNIQGEVFLDIRQHLMALPGQKIEDIKMVRSHPIALLQCSDWLRNYRDWDVVETFDTAGSARMISENGIRNEAAIASEHAAHTYNLEIIASNIENVSQNQTRFLIVGKNGVENRDADKASVSFGLSHSVGSLAAILGLWSECGLNLSKIQSIPIPGKPYEYQFIVDLNFTRVEDFDKGITEAEALTTNCRVLGIYKKGKKANENSTSKAA